MVMIVGMIAALAIAVIAAGVPHGTPEKAQAYYRSLATVLEIRTSDTILDSTLDDVPAYLGYAGLTGADLQRLSPDVLMDPVSLGNACARDSNGAAGGCAAAISNPTAFRAALAAAPLRSGDILVSRFFAPKITNVNDPPATRGLGWRKLIRLRTRPGSQAAKHAIDGAIILFNFFTLPGVKPFGADAESVNTQVILTTTAPNRDSIYWLDYGKVSLGGKLSLQLDASFDARDFDPNTGQGGGQSGIQPYFVPDGCVGCHGGENEHKALVNYLDTDHWFDRLDNDFSRVRLEGSAVLFDAGTDDSTAPDYLKAFNVIRQFNKEAEQQAAVVQPESFHRAAARKWLQLHENSADHFPPIVRAVLSTPAWTLQLPNDAEELALLNRYCFRCHGTIKFNVFDKAAVSQRSPQIRDRLQPLPEQLRRDPGFVMPLDRKLPPADLQRILELLPQ